MLGLGLLSDESSLRNPAPPGRLTNSYIPNRSSLSFTRVVHLYPMSKWLNELNVINLKLYMSHFLIPWGVMTSHLRSRGCKFIEG